MKYFIDTEFKEYFKQHRLFGIPIGYKTPTIDLISIGIISEDEREYYALNKECDLKEIWNDEWLRKNVLMPIYRTKLSGDTKNQVNFTYSAMKWIFKTFGETKDRIANNIKYFVFPSKEECEINNFFEYQNIYSNPEFYGYYADYDWVVFCQLFGRMMNLPKGFPMYCKDLKQMMDDKGLDKKWKRIFCPDPKGEHNALIDAKWNLKLYNKIIENKP